MFILWFAPIYFVTVIAVKLFVKQLYAAKLFASVNYN